MSVSSSVIDAATSPADRSKPRPMFALPLERIPNCICAKGCFGWSGSDCCGSRSGGSSPPLALVSSVRNDGEPGVGEFDLRLGGDGALWTAFRFRSL